MLELKVDACVGSSLEDAFVLARRFVLTDTRFGRRPDPKRTEHWCLRVVAGAVVDAWATLTPLFGLAPLPSGGACSIAARFGSSERLFENDALLGFGPTAPIEITPTAPPDPPPRQLTTLGDGALLAHGLDGSGAPALFSLDGESASRLAPPPLASLCTIGGPSRADLVAISNDGEVSEWSGSWSAPRRFEALAWPLAAWRDAAGRWVVVASRGAGELDGGRFEPTPLGGEAHHATHWEGEGWVVGPSGLFRLDRPDDLSTDLSGHHLHPGDALLITASESVTALEPDGARRRLGRAEIEAAMGSGRPLWESRALETDRGRLRGAYPRAFGAGYEPVRYGTSHVVGDSFEAAWILGRRSDDVERPGPGEGESFVGRVVDGRIQHIVTTPVWLWDLGRSPSGRVYVAAFSDAQGGVWRTPPDGSLAWERLQFPAAQGVFALDDEHVIAWSGDAFHRFDGRDVRPMPSPPARALHVHGCAPDFVVVVGHDGLAARWDGRAWRPWAIPFRGPISRVFVVSPDELYATTPGGALLEGSQHGWAERAPLEGMGTGVAKWRGEVYVGDPTRGLMRLEGDALVETGTPAFPVNLHPGADALLMAELTCFSETRDLESVRRIDDRDLAIALRDVDPSWR